MNTQAYAPAAPLISAPHHPQTPPSFYKRVLRLGNRMMLISTLMIIASIFVSYVFPNDFSLVMQASGHLSVVLFAASLKLGYVMRLTGRKGLGECIL